MRQGSLRPLQEALRQSWEDLVREMVSPMQKENHCEDGGHHQEAGEAGLLPTGAKATGPGRRHLPWTAHLAPEGTATAKPPAFQENDLRSSHKGRKCHSALTEKSLLPGGEVCRAPPAANRLGKGNEEAK